MLNLPLKPLDSLTVRLLQLSMLILTVLEATFELIDVLGLRDELLVVEAHIFP